MRSDSGALFGRGGGQTAVKPHNKRSTFIIYKTIPSVIPIICSEILPMGEGGQTAVKHP